MSARSLAPPLFAEVQLGSTRARCDLSSGADLSVPISFDERSARAFHLPAATRAPFTLGDFVGDVAQGGSVNCDVLAIAPHGNGTHTECVGHVVEDRVYVDEAVPRSLVLTRLVTVSPARLEESGERYSGDGDGDDRVITRAGIEDAWPAAGDERAIVLRTGAFVDAFSGTNPPYLTDDAARLLRERGVDHVLVDLPSVDKEDDGGALSAHRIFFGLAPGQRTLAGEMPPARTITELCRVPAGCADGRYLLSLGVAPLLADAAPARPLLFALETALETDLENHV